MARGIRWRIALDIDDADAYMPALGTVVVTCSNYLRRLLATPDGANCRPRIGGDGLRSF